MHSLILETRRSILRFQWKVQQVISSMSKSDIICGLVTLLIGIGGLVATILAISLKVNYESTTAEVRYCSVSEEPYWNTIQARVDIVLRINRTIEGKIFVIETSLVYHINDKNIKCPSTSVIQVWRDLVYNQVYCIDAYTSCTTPIGFIILAVGITIVLVFGVIYYLWIDRCCK